MFSPMEANTRIRWPDVPTDLRSRASLFGPVTASRLARAGLIYGAVCVLGLLLAAGTESIFWRAAGLGLTFPGAGFLAHAHGGFGAIAVHAGLAGFTLIGFAAALGIWFGTGNAILPIAVWVGGAIAAGLMDHGGFWAGSVILVPSLLFTGILVVLCGSAVYRRRARETRRADDAYLSALPAGRVRSTAAVSSAATEGELSPEDLKLMRLLLDRALQPLDAFEGFEWVDQFQTAAVRYQLNFAGYALALAHYARLPAMGGYMLQAQRNLIDKQRDHRVWRYWAAENLWGNLEVDADPAARDNIMYAGFCAAQIALYQAASGDRRFDDPGSFSLRHPAGPVFDYDFGKLVDALLHGMEVSAFGLMPCEPNWIYPVCNAIGASAVVARDSQRGSHDWHSVSERYRKGLLREFTNYSGRLIPCRSAYTGLGMPRTGGAVADAMPSLFLATHLPDLAWRNWHLARRDMLGGDRLNTGRFWAVDVGNYRRSRASSYAGVAAVAAEMGDDDVCAIALEALDDECPGVEREGVSHRPQASVFAHALEFMARAGGAGTLNTMVHCPRTGLQGPRLEEVPYPDVLVARAVNRDGALFAVLRPGHDAGRFRIGTGGLVPGAQYTLDGAASGSVRADGDGEASFDIVLDGRCELHLTPASG